MRSTTIILILMALITSGHSRDEVYAPDGFINMSARLLNDNIAIIAVEVSKLIGPEKPIDVKVLEVIHGPKSLLRVTTIHDDAFDPVFNKQFKKGTTWILRVMPRSVSGRKQWVVSYYETSHLGLVGDHATGSILKHQKVQSMEYSAFKKLLSEMFAKKQKPNRTREDKRPGG
jgi:hypothetical protein